MTRDDKIAKSLAQAIRASGLQEGMTISFHHHLRDGDRVQNLVLAECARLGLKQLTVNTAAIMACHRPVLEHIREGIVAGIECNYMHPSVGHAISKGVMPGEVIFRSHGGRPAALARGQAKIDVAFIAASATDRAGNCNGQGGPSAFGSIGYAMPDALHARHVIVVSDHLEPYPLTPASIDESRVDAVVLVDSIGDPDKIISGTTRVTRDPVGLLIAQYAAKALQASGLVKEGLSFQTGAGGASLAVARYLGDIMRREGITGSFASGGITGMLVDLFEEGLFRSLLDVQCFDREAVRSMINNEKHREISASTYASPAAGSAVVDHLDMVILGATQVDLTFNVNVHTDSQGLIMGGSGGHSDTAAGARLTVIVAPLLRARLPLIVDRVGTITTPGRDVDLLVTQYGLACHPDRGDLKEKLIEADLPIRDIGDLKAKAESLAGIPARKTAEGRTVARVISRDGELLDRIRAVC
ncbi:MAG: citrate lyase subunit alpha [Clostridiaceae bacterium]|nr:citrate lyase subunit alpha [Clostridiaceae bacterium]